MLQSVSRFVLQQQWLFVTNRTFLKVIVPSKFVIFEHINYYFQQCRWKKNLIHNISIVQKLRLHWTNHEKISCDCMFFILIYFSILNIFIFSNYHEDNEGLVNRQINLELYASYVYTAMAHHFDRSDVALKGKKISTMFFKDIVLSFRSL